MNFGSQGHLIRSDEFNVTLTKKRIEITVEPNPDGTQDGCEKVPIVLQLYKGTIQDKDLIIESDNLVYVDGKYKYQLNVIVREPGPYHLRLYRHLTEWKRSRLHYANPFPGDVFEKVHLCEFKATIKLRVASIVY